MDHEIQTTLKAPDNFAMVLEYRNKEDKLLERNWVGIIYIYNRCKRYLIALSNNNLKYSVKK